MILFLFLFYLIKQGTKNKIKMAVDMQCALMLASSQYPLHCLNPRWSHCLHHQIIVRLKIDLLVLFLDHRAVNSWSSCTFLSPLEILASKLKSRSPAPKQKKTVCHRFMWGVLGKEIPKLVSRFQGPTWNYFSFWLEANTTI